MGGLFDHSHSIGTWEKPPSTVGVVSASTNLTLFHNMPVRYLQDYVSGGIKRSAPNSDIQDGKTDTTSAGDTNTTNYNTENSIKGVGQEKVRVPKRRVVNTGQYRKCLNHQTLEMLSALNSIAASETVKRFSGTEYRVSSVDGKTYPINLLTNKLWDIIKIKLTELVPYDKKDRRFGWDEREEWSIYLSIKTIADCLGLSTKVDALTHLYGRIIAAINVLRNINITVIKGKNNSKINGYLTDVGVRDCSDTEEERLTKSNAIFALVINPELVDYIAKENLPLYHFNHSWLYLPEHSQNAYAAAKYLGRCYSQHTYKRKAPRTEGVTMEIGTLRDHLPGLKNGVEKGNRVSLNNALATIPSIKYVYLRDGKKLTFEDLAWLRLRTPGYNKVQVSVKYGDHPNTSDNKVTADLIKNMNDDTLYVGRSVYHLDDAGTVINQRGAIRNP